MSNYTTFFPQAAGGGSVDITDPDKLPKLTLTSEIGNPFRYYGNSWYSLTSSGFVNTGYGPDWGIGTNDFIFGTGNFFQGYDGGIVTQTSNNTQITLANVTGSGGYLCNIITPAGAAATTQEIEITIDGGTAKTYTIDYSSNTSIDDYEQRVLLGFFSTGGNSNSNKPNNNASTGITCVGGAGATYNDTSVPPMHYGGSTTMSLRLFTPQEFKQYNLPKLRFESSLLVKTKTTSLAELFYNSNAGKATYYLDNQL